ncbi:MAG: ribonuclease HII [Rhodospirillales bacterium]
MPDLVHERALAAQGFAAVCGVDEAGRGPWAGPVTAAAVMFPGLYIPPALAALLDDSKALTRARREGAYAALTAAQNAGDVMFAAAEASVEEIDSINILAAAMLAMRRAVLALPVPPDAALIDGPRAPDLPCRAAPLVKGDSKSLSIAAASIIAKVTRDAAMAEYARRWPGYGFERHAGYGTAAHRAALTQLGPCPIHRRTFAPIRKMLSPGA